jgi:hypothetical protein
MEPPPEMSQESRKEYLAKMIWRYARRGREGKSRLLDEVCEVCGYERKHAIKVLGGKFCAPVSRAGRKAVYAKDVVRVIKPIWLSSEQPCGKRLKEQLPLWLPHYERRHGELGAELKRKVLTASAATLDRLLSPYRSAHPRRWRTPKPGTLIKAQVPVRTDNADIVQPGSVEMDSVAHCGGSLLGDLVWSINMTDVVSQWTQTQAVWNKGQYGVVQAVAQMEGELPFQLTAVDIDNGSEFLNWHMAAYLNKRPDGQSVALTRSRPYHKNDNAHIEQKNWTHVRQLIGYDRLGQEASVAALNEVYAEWNLLQNFFSATMKLKSKHREGGKYRKSYHPAQTPAQRLLEWEGLSQEKRQWIKQMQAQLDPFELHQRVEAKLRKLWATEKAAAQEQSQEAQAEKKPKAVKGKSKPQSQTADGGRGGAHFGAVASCVTGSLRSPSTSESTAPKCRAS